MCYNLSEEKGQPCQEPGKSSPGRENGEHKGPRQGEKSVQRGLSTEIEGKKHRKWN